mgnify:FL=1
MSTWFQSKFVLENKKQEAINIFQVNTDIQMMAKDHAEIFHCKPTTNYSKPLYTFYILIMAVDNAIICFNQ